MNDLYKRPDRAAIAARVHAEQAPAKPAPASTGTGPAIAAIRFGMRTATERRRRGWTLAQAAHAAGIGTMQLAAIERGAPNVRLTAAVRTAAALAISLDTLLGPCPQCADTPPRGFTCNTCGAASD